MERFGFLQLCADRRFHRATMEAFEAHTGLGPDEYWIEATAGGAAALEVTPTASFAWDNGARILGWAAHGDRCGGFPGSATEEIAARLESVARARLKDFPGAEHWTLFATESGIEVARPGGPGAIVSGGG